MAPAPSPNAASGPTVKEELRQVRATVEAVDPATRAVTLRGPNGEVTLIAGPEVRNFAQIHVGDELLASYYVAVSATVASAPDSGSASGGSANSVTQTTTTSYTAPLGSRPAGAFTRTATMTVKIEAVDTAADKVTLRRPGGTERTVEAKTPELHNLIQTLAPGDDVDVTYGEAVAIEMRPVQK